MKLLPFLPSARPVGFAVSTTILLFLSAGSINAFPEFQQFIVKNSRRPVNCAYCHPNADGPEGTAAGQIGNLTAAEQAELVRARGAFEPGQEVNSPILNGFGNHIINSVGKRRFLEIRLAPAELAEALPKDSDLDADGISDSQEYLAGTHPLLRSDGQPWQLFRANIAKNSSQILLTLAATVLGLWGLGHLLRGYAAAAHFNKDEEAPN
ncbi:MAG TPA: hypothetical protein P5186_05610 [Candidatus Paceibacterota bacterium]|nr:hypothetical protein [Verrucomicrobiota bacterium]HRY47504.1 hypothetical protein [Candidatus Paceibacterota bacterium]